MDLYRFRECLTSLLSLDSEQLKTVLNYESTRLRPLFASIHQFLFSYASIKALSDFEETFILNNCHSLLLKFLLRLCPSFHLANSNSSSGGGDGFGSIIPPKKFIENLLQVDFIGFPLHLFQVWHHTSPAHLNFIKADLIPSSLIEKFTQFAKIVPFSSMSSDEKDFLEWITEADLTKIKERDSVLKRFEFESDDDLIEDEYFGTRPARDGGQAVESEQPSDDPIQSKLLSAYIHDPSIFSRTRQVRSSPGRKDLLHATKLSHEQIEGWAIMLDRNPKKSKILQDFMLFNR